MAQLSTHQSGAQAMGSNAVATAEWLHFTVDRGSDYEITIFPHSGGLCVIRMEFCTPNLTFFHVDFESLRQGEWRHPKWTDMQPLTFGSALPCVRRTKATWQNDAQSMA